jgi:hypothetical protein
MAAFTPVWTPTTLGPAEWEPTTSIVMAASTPLTVVNAVLAFARPFEIDMLGGNGADAVLDFIPDLKGGMWKLWTPQTRCHTHFHSSAPVIMTTLGSIDGMVSQAMKTHILCGCFYGTLKRLHRARVRTTFEHHAHTVLDLVVCTKLDGREVGAATALGYTPLVISASSAAASIWPGHRVLPFADAECLLYYVGRRNFACIRMFLGNCGNCRGRMRFLYSFCRRWRWRWRPNVEAEGT